MGRKVLAVILGYIVMAVVLMGGLTVVYLAMGQDTAFEQGTYEVTGLWMVVWAVASVVAALTGGYVCGKIGKSKGAVISLMVLIAVLGATSLVFLKTAETPAEDLIRIGDTPNMEAMFKAQAPTWMYIAESLIGVIGAMFGASLGCGCKKDHAGGEVSE